MKILVISIALLVGPVACGQVIGTIEGGGRTSYLYERVVRSEFVLRGKAVEWKSIMVRNIPKPEIQPNGGLRFELKDLDGGMVMKVEFIEPLCRQADFEIPGAARDLPSSPLYIFTPPGERQSDLFPGMGQAREMLYQGHEYLLFLVRHPKPKSLLERYRLDEDKTYYRVYDGYLGAQELSGTIGVGERRAGDYVLKAVEGLCGAVRGVDPKEKLVRLRALLEKAEPDWRKSVEQAIAGVEAGMKQ